MATPKLYLKKSMLADFDSIQSENGNSLREVADVGYRISAHCGRHTGTLSEMGQSGIIRESTSLTVRRLGGVRNRGY